MATPVDSEILLAHLRDKRPDIELIVRHPLAAPVYDDDYGGRAKPLAQTLPAPSNDAPIVATIARGVVAAPWCYLLAGDELVWDSVENVARHHHRARDAYSTILRAAHSAIYDMREVALVGSQRLHAYWHWWVDVVPRFWLVDRVKPGLPFILPPLKHAWQSQSLDLLGLTDRILTLESGAHRYASVTFSNGLTNYRSRYPSPLLSEFSAWLRSTLDIGPPSGVKVYVRRQPEMPRGVCNEPEVLDYLEGDGFVCVDAGTLPLEEQAKLFASASVVVGPHGAGLTNLLFSAPGTLAIELFTAEGAQDCSCYRALTSRLGQPYGRVTVATGRRAERRSPHNDAMSISVDRLDRALQTAS